MSNLLYSKLFFKIVLDRKLFCLFHICRVFIDSYKRVENFQSMIMFHFTYLTFDLNKYFLHVRCPNILPKLYKEAQNAQYIAKNMFCVFSKQTMMHLMCYFFSKKTTKFLLIF